MYIKVICMECMSFVPHNLTMQMYVAIALSNEGPAFHNSLLRIARDKKYTSWWRTTWNWSHHFLNF